MVLFPGSIRDVDRYTVPECSRKLESLHFFFSSGKQALQIFTLLHLSISTNSLD